MTPTRFRCSILSRESRLLHYGAMSGRDMRPRHVAIVDTGPNARVKVDLVFHQAEKAVCGLRLTGAVSNQPANLIGYNVLLRLGAPAAKFDDVVGDPDILSGAIFVF